MSDAEFATEFTVAATPGVAFHTLGCKLNQYESDALASKFVDAGYRIVPFHEQADVYIINSCTVTNKADRKTRNVLNRALRLSSATVPTLGRSPGQGAKQPPMVVMTGCFVDSHKDELERDGRSFVVDNEHKNSIFELVDAHLKGEIVHPESMPADRFNYSGTRQLFRTRGMVKIQDGCDNFCSFCIIPFVRGKAISRSKAEILRSAQQMVADGYRELVLTGVNMSRYNYEGATFSTLLEELLELKGDYRLRISSIEPDRLDERFIRLLGHERMTPHLHLCLQSASEKILLKMRRQYTYHQYRKLAESIREQYADFNISTDLIVGFPGEGEEEFGESLDALGQIAFGHVHVFKYSIRKGTRAERMEGHVQEKVKTERSEIIRREAELVKRRYRQELIGKTQRVLVERVTTEQGRGLGEHYVPIHFPLPDLSPSRQAQDFENQYLSVKVLGIDDGDDPDLRAEILV